MTSGTTVEAEAGGTRLPSRTTATREGLQLSGRAGVASQVTFHSVSFYHGGGTRRPPPAPRPMSPGKHAHRVQAQSGHEAHTLGVGALVPIGAFDPEGLPTPCLAVLTVPPPAEAAPGDVKGHSLFHPLRSPSFPCWGSYIEGLGRSKAATCMEGFRKSPRLPREECGLRKDLRGA